MKTRMKTGRYMQNVYPFSQFRRFVPEKWPLFLDFATTFKKLPLSSRKWVRVWYTFWSGVEGPELFTVGWKVVELIEVIIPGTCLGELVGCYDRHLALHCLKHHVEAMYSKSKLLLMDSHLGPLPPLVIMEDRTHLARSSASTSAVSSSPRRQRNGNI